MPTPLLLTAQLRALEAQAAAGLPPGTLMQRAGAAAARFIAERHPAARRIAIVCGPGNNGGDGYACALELARRGRQPALVALAAPVAADARAAAASWQQAGGRTLAAVPAAGTFDLVVDAMFGIGLARALAGSYLEAARWIDAQPVPRIALDVPSGIDADTGAWVGGVAGAGATATLSFIAAKPGLHTGAGVAACGSVHVESLGVGTGSAAEQPLQLNTPDCFAPLAQRRARDTHKGRCGDVLVIGGNVGMTGAPLLAARAALRLGAGRVHVDAIGGGIAVDPLAPELMFRAATAVTASHAIVIGCGLGDDARAAASLAHALAHRGPVVFDADALNLLAARPLPDPAPAARVLTPHPLEAARLLASSAAQVQADRLAAAGALARGYAAWVVLKGAGSVIAAPDGRCWINPTGSPALATAGSGDVLAGMIGALLAQGHDTGDAVRGATWLHGRAADDFGADLGLVASEIAPLAARALARLRGFTR